ncbi:lantibiotic dehydratase [Rhizohabitans arisaemae]|uniref:lantibiotic dehydratase n=1 Tax=Rhizohabitans arisaemae TaxID=2720610 RepID=UPI0024B22D6C|nr:lantibiotic dehydratase [Rhizohabitans arisaemae]
MLRSTGFPIGDLLDLTDDALTAAADDPDLGAEEKRKAWDAGLRAISVRMLAVIGGDLFHEALTWQNPPLVDRLLSWMVRHTEADGSHVRNSTRRAQEVSVTRYIQRYHTRNETIGFFGPATWASFDDDVPHASVTPGPTVISERKVYFEEWLIHSVGVALARSPALRRGLAPALTPGTALHGDFASRPGRPPAKLDPAEKAVIRAIDGRRTPTGIERLLSAAAHPGIRGLRDVLDVLERLFLRELIVWRPDVPMNRYPERGLRAQLAALPDSPDRTEALTVLDRLEAAKDRIAAAAGDPKTLAEALVDLDEEYGRLTGGTSTRTRDVKVIGRNAVFEECGRDLELTLGGELRETLAPPLALVLDSARWLVHRFGVEVERWAGKVYDEHLGLFGEEGVPLGMIFRQYLSELGRQPWVPPLVARFQQAWAHVLDFDPTASRVGYTARELAAAVRETFPAQAPGWYSGRQHSPDVMIAARGAESLAAGEYEFVLGELHVGTLTLDAHAFLSFHDRPDLILRAAEERLEYTPRLVPMYPRTPAITGRDYPTPEVFSDKYWYLSYGAGHGERDAPETRRLSLFDVNAVRDPTTGRIGVPVPTGETLGILDALGELMVRDVANLFKPIPPLPHTPRITIDRMVMSRETWRVPAARIPIGKNSGELEKFTEIRRWAKGLGMPRFMFWRAAEGKKPIYLDLDSPLFVADFVSSVRKAARIEGAVVTLAEMHPGPDHVWLPDAKGGVYTSELRIAVLDEHR